MPGSLCPSFSCSRQPSPGQKGFHFIAVSKAGPGMKGQRNHCCSAVGAVCCDDVCCSPAFSAVSMCPPSFSTCKMPRPSAHCRAEADWGVEHVSCKRCVFEVLHLVCPLMIVLLWLLSIWKNKSVNKRLYLLSELESAHTPPFCCNGYSSCFLQSLGPTRW